MIGNARRRIALVAMATGLVTLLSACGDPSTAKKQSKVPPTTVEMSHGEELFTRKCGFCHIGRNTGTVMLERRLGPGQGELAERRDLDADYVKNVARNGLMSMPPFSRVEVTDEQLDEIAVYLARNNPNKAPKE